MYVQGVLCYAMVGHALLYTSPEHKHRMHRHSRQNVNVVFGICAMCVMYAYTHAACMYVCMSLMLCYAMLCCTLQYFVMLYYAMRQSGTQILNA